jgi:hypothetical protein
MLVAPSPSPPPQPSPPPPLPIIAALEYDADDDEPELPPDTAPPVITLFGASRVEVAQLAEYVDEGAWVLDSVDGGYAVRGDGLAALDTSLPTAPLRPFVVTFRAVDAAGNAATPVSNTASPPLSLSPLNLSNTLPTAPLRPFVVTFRAVDAAGNAATPVSGAASMHWTAGGVVMWPHPELRVHLCSTTTRGRGSGCVSGRWTSNSLSLARPWGSRGRAIQHGAHRSRRKFLSKSWERVTSPTEL